MIEPIFIFLMFNAIIWDPNNPFFVVFTLIFSFFLSVFNIHKIRKSHKEYKKYRKTPFFNQALIGLYVKIVGKVISPNRYKTPRVYTNVAFYRFVIFGYRQVKRKKPGIGMEEISTILHREISDSFEIQNQNNQKVFVEIKGSPTNKSVIFNLKQESLRSETPITNHEFNSKKSEKNYTHYDYIADTLKQHDTITVYGRVIKKDDRFVITTTDNLKLPLRIEAGEQLFTKKEFYKKERRRFVFLVLEMGLFLFLMTITYFFDY